ncbi:MAG TPA: aspartate aminotransferase family protein [Blastocatellia bacterium]|nr:aspartate aminotransferase family protein [Blastocatellia bacterium]
MNIFEEMESNVRTYCRVFTDTFVRAKGSTMYSESGAEFIDFFAGAGTLNYGHNNEYITEKVISYLKSDGLVHSLDMHTGAKRTFLERFSEVILKPKELDYKVQFCGPTGANSVEAALKIARKVKKRPGIFSFMGSYHGLSLGSLSVTSGLSSRAAGQVPLNNVTFMPYPHGFMSTFDSIRFIEAVLTDSHSGIEKPAAMIFETVQAEGGVVVAPVEWMQRLRRLCDEHDVLLICDDIQVGCGRTGPFFSFERAGIVPDIVTLSKSISGYGAPMSLVLMKPEHDIWKPGEHTGTFRGYQLACVGATAALDLVEKGDLRAEVEKKAAFVDQFLDNEIRPISDKIAIRGLGLIWGVDLSGFGHPSLAQRVSARSYELGLIVERVGREGAVLKILPPLTIDMGLLEKGCRLLRQAILESID